MSRVRRNKRQFKKGLRKIEADLGRRLKSDDSNLELAGQLDFWVSDFASWLFQKTELSKDVWSNGIAWENDDYILKFSELSPGKFSLNCELDIIAELSSRSIEGKLEATFQFCRNFKVFEQYKTLLSVDRLDYAFDSSAKTKI
jgi:hypothetical protein